MKLNKKNSGILVLIVTLALVFYGIYQFKIMKGAYDAFNEQSSFRFDALSSYIQFEDAKVKEDIEMIGNLKLVKDLSMVLSSFVYSHESILLGSNVSALKERELYDYFKAYARSHPELKYIYYATQSGGYAAWPMTEIKANYDPRVRPWYLEALVANGNIVRTKPYIDLVTNEYIISNVKAVFDDKGGIIGVVGIDISYSALGKALSYLPVNSYDRILIFHESGMVLNDTDNLLDEIELDKTLKRDRYGNFFYEIDGKKYLSRLYKIPDSPLIIMNMSVYDSLIDAFRSSERWNVFLFLLSLLLMVASMVLLFYYVYYSKLLKRDIQDRVSFQKTIEYNIPGVVFRSKAHWPWLMVYMSDNVNLLTGYKAEEFLSPNYVRQWRDLVFEEDLEVLDLPLEMTVGKEYSITYRILNKDEQLKWVSEIGRVVQDEEGTFFIDGVILDVTEKMKSQEELNRVHSELEHMVETLQDRNLTLVEANLENQALYEEMAAAEETLRYNYDELEAYRVKLEEEKLRYQLILKASKEAFWEYNISSQEFLVANIFNWTDTTFEHLDQFLNRIHPEDRHKLIWFNPSSDGNLPEVFEVEARVEVKENLYRWHHFIGIVVKNVFGGIQKIVGSLNDVHDMVIQKERIMFYAFHDSGTGLYNLDYLLERVSSDLTVHGSEKQILLVAGVLNYGKMVESYGRDKTDILLFQLGASLKSVFSHIEEISTLSRGRFAVWLRDLYNKNDVEHAVREIKSHAKSYMYHEILSYGFGFVFSGVILNAGIHESQKVLSFAEVAFDYAEKNMILSEFVWFDGDMQKQKEREILVNQYLRRAIENKEFYVQYQPQYDGFDKKNLRGYEALVRWKNDILGNVSPGEFIPLAEESGLIVDIGRFIIHEAILLIKEYEALYDKPLHIAINASFIEIVREDYVPYLVHQVEKYGLDPKLLHIEITETAISAFIDSVINNLQELSDYGFEIHMDDFGTGYSSLSQLGRLPVNVLKIDQSFVAKLEEDKKMYELTQMIIQMGHGFHLSIIAEGVENYRQYQLLKDMQCDFYQGYGLSRPISREDVLKQ